MEAFQTKNIALFIDFENIHSEEFDVEKLVERLKERGRLIVKKAYGDWGRFIRVKQTMMFNSVELVEMPAVGYRGKNSSDIKLTIDALETAFHRPYIDTFVVVSGDSDFTPLISKLRELDRYVIVVSSKDNTSKLLKGFCDELIYISAVCGGQEETLSLPTGYDLLRRAVDSLENLRGEARSSLVKSQMVRLDPSFSEENFGFKQFRRFLEQAQRDGAIRLKMLGDGEHRVSLSGGDKPGPEPEPPRNEPPAKKEPPPRGGRAKSAVANGNRAGSVSDGNNTFAHASGPDQNADQSASPGGAKSKAANAVETVSAAALDPERLKDLTNTILLGWSLGRHQDQSEVDLNELAHCCKRLDPKTTPEYYGIPKSRGFKGLVQLAQEQGLVQIDYQNAGNHYWIGLTPAGQERLRQLPRPRTYLEHRYRSLLKNGLFRARLNNEKMVQEALTVFLTDQQSREQPALVRDFLTFAGERIHTLGVANVRHILDALHGIEAITLSAENTDGLEERAIVQVDLWPAVVERIVRWHVAKLQEETGEVFQKELYLRVLKEENNKDVLAELGIEIEVA